MTLQSVIDLLQSIALVGLSAQVAMLRRQSKVKIDLRGASSESLFRSLGRVPEIPPARPDGASYPPRPPR